MMKETNDFMLIIRVILFYCPMVVALYFFC